MAIAYRSTSTASGTTSASLAAPSGVQIGDVLIALKIDRATSGTTTAPAGWTRINSASGTSGRGEIFYRVHDANNTGPWSFTGTTRTQVTCIAFSGVDTTTPLDVTPTIRRNASGTTGTTSITPVTAGNMLVALFGTPIGNYTWSAEATANIAAGNWTEAVDSAYSTYTSIAISYYLQATAAASGASSATMSTNAINIGALVSLRPSNGYSTAGKTTAGGSSFVEAAGSVVLAKVNVPVGSGVGKTLKLYCNGNTTGCNVKLLVYDDDGGSGNPGTRLFASSAQAITTTPGWVSVSLSDLALGGDCYIGAVGDGQVRYYADAGSGLVIENQNISDAYATPPSTYPTPQYTDTTVIMSGYIEYQEGGGNGSFTGATLTATASLSSGSLRAYGSLAGASLSTTASITSGSLKGGARLSGAALSSTATLTGGALRGSAAMPGSAMSATAALAPGSLMVRAVMPGATLSAAAVVSGGSLKGGAKLSGSALTASATITAGALRARGALSGASLGVTATLTPGSMRVSGWISGATLSATSSLSAGSIKGGSKITGATLSAVGTLTAGHLLGSARMAGQTFPVTSSISSGSLRAGGRMTGAGISITASLAAGALHGSAHLGGAQLTASVAFAPGSLLNPAASIINGATFTARTSIEPGAFSGGGRMSGASLTASAAFTTGGLRGSAMMPGSILDLAASLSAGNLTAGGGIAGVIFEVITGIQPGEWSGGARMPGGSFTNTAVLTAGRLMAGFTVDISTQNLPPVSLIAMLTGQERFILAETSAEHLITQELNQTG
ncbi:MAG: hypothetical protein HGB02_08530 [Chlorobiaceae bacterium]|nr:hypothetical protein [Chlorobiaceae bacterium]